MARERGCGNVHGDGEGVWGCVWRGRGCGDVHGEGEEEGEEHVTKR